MSLRRFWVQWLGLFRVVGRISSTFGGFCLTEWVWQLWKKVSHRSQHHFSHELINFFLPTKVFFPYQSVKKKRNSSLFSYESELSLPKYSIKNNFSALSESLNFFIYKYATTQRQYTLRYGIVLSKTVTSKIENFFQERIFLKQIHTPLVKNVENGVNSKLKI